VINIFHRAATSPVEQALQSIDMAMAKCERIRTQLTDTERALGVSKEAAADHAASGHSLEDWGQDIAAQEAACSALRTALTRAEDEFKQAQAELAHEQDQAQRAESIKQIEQLQEDMAEPTGQLLDAIKRLRPLLSRGASFALDIKQILGLVEQLAIELPGAFELTRAALTQYVESVRSGSARATLPSVEETKPRAPSAPPPEVSAFPLYDCTFVDSRNQQRHSARYWDIGLAPEVFAKAAAAGVVVASDDPQAKKLRKERTGLGVDLDRLVNLDADVVEKPPALPQKWGRVDPLPKWGEGIRTNQSLTSLTGQQSWMNPNRPATPTGWGT
jgi:hypothetical protein